MKKLTDDKTYEVVRFFCIDCGHQTSACDEGWCSYGCPRDGEDRLKTRSYVRQRVLVTEQPLEEDMTKFDIFNFIADVMAVYDGGGSKLEISYDDATFHYVISRVPYGPLKMGVLLGTGRSIGEAFQEAMDKHLAADT